MDKKIDFATHFFFHLNRECRKYVLTKFAAHHAAGSVGHRSRLGRCDRGVSGGGQQPPLAPLESSHDRCLARHAGHLAVVQKAQVSPLCNVSVFFGAQVLRGRNAHSDGSGEKSPASPERMTVERTSVFVGTHRPSRDDAGAGGLAMVRPTFTWDAPSGAGTTRERFRLP